MYKKIEMFSFNFKDIREFITEREYIFLIERFEKKRSYIAIGRGHDITAERVRQIIWNAQRKLRGTVTQRRLKMAGTGGKIGIPHTEEQRRWARELIAKLHGKISLINTRPLDLPQEYVRIFHRELSLAGIVQFLRAVRDRDSKIRKKIKTRDITYSQVQILKCLEKSKYVVYVFDAEILGFDNKEQVREYLEKNIPQVPVKVFESIPIEIKTTVAVIV